MTFHRKRIGKPVHYRGHTIVTRFCGPDLMCYVDNCELPLTFVTRLGAIRAGERFIDNIISEEKDNASKKTEGPRGTG